MPIERDSSMPEPVDEAPPYGRPTTPWRLRIYRLVFESDTRAGRLFDIVLLVVILASVLVVMLDSVQTIARRYGALFDALEWGFTVLFTIEYVLRVSCVRYPLRYARSFFGIVDLLAVLPSYLAILLPEAMVLIDVRVLRLLRVVRILKLSAYLDEYVYLGEALRASRPKIMVFIGAVLIAVMIGGTVMYLAEGPANGFTSIPTSVYWAISTMTTVGFGDIAPKTDIGRLIASLMMLLGWGVLAVPTGIVTAEVTVRHSLRHREERRCEHCGSGGHVASAAYCKDCGYALAKAAAPPR